MVLLVHSNRKTWILCFISNLLSWLCKYHLHRKSSSAIVTKDVLWKKLRVKLRATCRTLALNNWCPMVWALLGDTVLTACTYWPKRGKFNYENKKKWCNGGGGEASYMNRCIKNTMCGQTSLKLNTKSRLNWNYMWLKIWWYPPLQKCYNGYNIR